MAGDARSLGAMTVVEEPTEVARAGDWVLAALQDEASVSSLVPAAFEQYGRIFHPAMREAQEPDLPLRAAGESKTGVPVRTRDHGVAWCEVSWREVAEANGRVAHPAMEWTSITGSYEYGWGGMQPGVWERVPDHGSLPLRLTRVLSEILAAFTTAPERCWCAVWEGYGEMIGLTSDQQLPRLAIENRAMIVAQGPLWAVPEKSFDDGFEQRTAQEWLNIERYQSPSLWWPDDRAWCVATDVDMQETYLGASADCINRLIGDDRLEAMPVAAGQSITIDADAINPTPTGDRTRA